ncbi:MAG TPA: sigma 54-interacting transcriptional regulator [Gemmataceae bacterium]|nr:sigma 54-interacting transcriptional regulator [Gemmataceae bacterium]
MRAQLTIEAGEGAPVVCDLDPSRPITLGRNRGNNIVLHDRHSSRWHAEVFYEGGRWFIRDRGTLNGTRLNGQRIKRPVPLANGDVIQIGDTCLRVKIDAAAPPHCEVVSGPRYTEEAVDNGTTPEMPALTTPEAPHPPDAEPASTSSTVLQPDELTALCSFMTASVEETSPRQLIERALTTVLSQTQATIVGFLSLDPDNPMPKIVLPELAAVDIHLSRQLTQKAQRTAEPVWLGARSGEDDSRSDSLLVFKDAVCVPLRAGPVPLGALHVYKSGRVFTEREVRFCAVLGGYLAKSLYVLRARRNLEAEYDRLRAHAPAAEDVLIGDSPPMQQLRQHIARLAPRSNTVLVVGESGVGKELVALALHRQSPRKDAPLVTVNCAAISASLSEAELFGHRRGTFTGAERDRSGFFQQADEGTLFLDEIGELSLECQAKLLRVIETKRFRPVGAEAEVEVDVRIIAATHRDLESLVRQGRFRQDLFFRLGIPIRVPPLREHPEDIPALVDHFLPRFCQEYRRPARLTAAALRRLQEYSWPGNVRQLRAVLENAVAMGDGEVIEATDLWLPHDERDLAGDLPSLKLEELEAWAIRRALRQTGGNLTQAADLLGIHRDTLAAKIKKYDIRKDPGALPGHREPP